MGGCSSPCALGGRCDDDSEGREIRNRLEPFPDPSAQTPVGNTFEGLRYKFDAPASAETLEALQNTPASNKSVLDVLIFHQPPNVFVGFGKALVNQLAVNRSGWFLEKTYAVLKKSALLEYATSLEGAVSYNFSRGTEIGANNLMAYEPIF